MDVLSFAAVLVLGVILLVVNVIQTYLGNIRAKEQTAALLLIRASIDELTSQLAQGCMVPRGGGGQGEEPGKK